MKHLLRSLFSGKQTITHASALLALTALLSNALGLFRNLVIFRFFSAEWQNVYAASFPIANFFFNLVIIGSVVTFVPIASELFANKKSERAFEVANELFTAATTIFGLIGVLLAFCMPFVIREIVAPHLPEYQLLLTIQLSRLMLFQMLFFSWSFIIGALLNAQKRFTSYALAPLVYNCAIIVGALLTPRFGIYSITLLVIFGAFLHFFIQYREALKTGFKLRFIFRLSPETLQVLRLMPPRSISQGMAQLVATTYVNLASGLAVGSIFIFQALNDLQTTPAVVVGNSLATATLPSLSAEIAKKEWHGFNQLLDKTLRTSLFLLIPTLLLTFILRAQIIRLYIGIGNATWEQTDLAIRTLIFFLIGIIPATLVSILSRIFYSLKDTRTPMWVSLLSGAVAISVAIIGIRIFHFDIATLALSESLVSITQCLAYILFLRSRAEINLSVSKLLFDTIRYLLGSILAAAGAWATLHLVDWGYQMSHFTGTDRVSGLLIQGVTAAGVGVALYFGYSKLRSQEELAWIHIRNFIPKR